MIKGECQKEKFIFEYDYPEHFTKCFWQKRRQVLPIWVAYRFILFLYFLATFVEMVFFRPEEGYVWYKNFIYFAHWSYFTQLLVYGIAFGITVARYTQEKKNPRVPPVEEMPWHYKTLWLLFNLAAPSAIVVTVLFWLFTYNPEVHTSLAFSLAVGLLNSLILIFDFCLWAIPYQFLHFYLPCLFAIVYATFTAVYQISGGTANAGQTAIYPKIVDWRKPGSTMTTVGIFIGCHFLFHCGVCVVQLIKIWTKKSREE